MWRNLSSLAILELEMGLSVSRCSTWHAAFRDVRGPHRLLLVWGLVVLSGRTISAATMGVSDVTSMSSTISSLCKLGFVYIPVGSLRYVLDDSVGDHVLSEGLDRRDGEELWGCCISPGVYVHGGSRAVVTLRWW